MRRLQTPRPSQAPSPPSLCGSQCRLPFLCRRPLLLYRQASDSYRLCGVTHGLRVKKTHVKTRGIRLRRRGPVRSRTTCGSPPGSARQRGAFILCETLPGTFVWGRLATKLGLHLSMVFHDEQHGPRTAVHEGSAQHPQTNRVQWDKTIANGGGLVPRRSVRWQTLNFYLRRPTELSRKTVTTAPGAQMLNVGKHMQLLISGTDVRPSVGLFLQLARVVLVILHVSQGRSVGK